MRACYVRSRYVLFSQPRSSPYLLCRLSCMRKRLKVPLPFSPQRINADKPFSFVDIETSREETKVRLRWHEHWQARHSSKETEEEVNVPTRTFRVQQVRAEITLLHHHYTLALRSKVPTQQSYVPTTFTPCSSRSSNNPSASIILPVPLHHPHAGDDGGGFWTAIGGNRRGRLLLFSGVVWLC